VLYHALARRHPLLLRPAPRIVLAGASRERAARLEAAATAAAGGGRGGAHLNH